MYSRRTDPHSCHIVKFYNLVMKSTTSQKFPLMLEGVRKSGVRRRGGSLREFNQGVCLVKGSEYWDFRGEAREGEAVGGRWTNFSIHSRSWLFPFENNYYNDY